MAVVILAYRLDGAVAVAAGTPLPEGATISLVDGNGVLLARAPPEPDWVGQRAREAAFTRTMLTSREGVMEGAGIDNVERLHGFAPLLASADLFAVVGLPWQAAFAEADRLFWQSATVTALAFVAAALLALISGEAWIRRPVAALQRVVGRMEHGDLAARARLERWSSPELHRLAASFNGMASSLQAPPGRAAGERGAAARGGRDRRRRHHHDQPARPDRGGQPRRRAPVRLPPRRADRRQRRAR